MTKTLQRPSSINVRQEEKYADDEKALVFLESSEDRNRQSVPQGHVPK
jgi:hypothetical protein